METSEEKKGLDPVEELLEKLKNECGKKVKKLLCGSGGPEQLLKIMMG